MRTKHYRNFFIIRGIVVEDEGYLCSDKLFSNITVVTMWTGLVNDV